MFSWQLLALPWSPRSPKRHHHPNLPPLAATPIELALESPTDPVQLPRGRVCDWQSISIHQQQETLLYVVAALNHRQRRCALIDVTDSLESPQWRLLTSSGQNWLVKPDTLKATLRCALFLLWSDKFRLVTLTGLSIDEIHPDDGAMLQAAVPRGSTLLFAPCRPWDHTGEPLLTEDPDLRWDKGSRLSAVG